MGTILVVDDSDFMAELLAVTLEDEGFTVVVATSGESALELVKEHRPEVAVCDLNMPGMDGIELMARLAVLDGALPVIMLTGDGATDTRLRAVRSGAFAFVEKNGDLTPLIEAVPRALARVRRARGAAA